MHIMEMKKKVHEEQDYRSHCEKERGKNSFDIKCTHVAQPILESDGA